MKIFLSNISNNEIIPDENFTDYGIHTYIHSFYIRTYIHTYTHIHIYIHMYVHTYTASIK